MALANIVLFAALLAIGAADLVNFSNCDESNDDICKVSEVRINPCPSGNTCVFKQGSNASIAFDFTPNFSTSNLKTMVWWVSATDMKFLGFGSDNACDYTSCPVAAGQPQTLNYNLYIGKKTPKATYPLKWKLWNPDNETEMCCFRMRIQIKKGVKNHTNK